jgi:hypothetical protein
LRLDWVGLVLFLDIALIAVDLSLTSARLGWFLGDGFLGESLVSV